MTPSPFLSAKAPRCPQNLLQRARSAPAVRTAIVRAGAALPMAAAKAAHEQGLMEPVFIGEPADIAREAALLGWDIAGFDLIETMGEANAATAGAIAARDGKVDALMKGQLHTDTYMRALIARENGLRTADRLVHVFHISPPDGGRPLIISDAAVNVSPDLETRKSAIRAVIAVARAAGIDRPRIAVLSATETPSIAIPSSMEAVSLVNWARETLDDIDISGPLALDLILSGEAVAIKGITHDPVAGLADAVIVPALVSGNTLFKALVYLAGGCAAGVVLGARVPILLTSRADPPEARLASAALAAILANRQS